MVLFRTDTKKTTKALFWEPLLFVQRMCIALLLGATHSLLFRAPVCSGCSAKTHRGDIVPSVTPQPVLVCVVQMIQDTACLAKLVCVVFHWVVGAVE